MTMKLYLGIDPGKMGGIAILYGDHIHVTAMHLAGNELDLDSIRSWVSTSLAAHLPCREWGKLVEAGIEKVGAMPGQGVTSMFSFGFSTGAMHGILAALNIPRHLVAPQTWKRKVLADTARDKVAAIEYCRRTFPNTSLLPTPRSHKFSSGMADALCIAIYMRDYRVAGK